MLRVHTRKVLDWLEHRTGIETIVKDFFYEEIPASSGWHQIIGSIAVFSFLIQIVTGILLAFNYAPTPGEAYNSLKYIVSELTAGRLIRGLHHWGASIMIIIVVLHMTQVFIYGAYKKPREATWMLGVVLLLVTLGFGLTGYLLPWDNRAYWGTVVTTQIISSAPLAGPYLARLLGGDGSIGVVTFARFYALHVLILPPLMMLLIAIHIYLVRKHGVAPAADDNAPKKRFFPEQVFKDTVGVFIVFMILFAMAAAVRVPLEKLADPTDTSYIPRPEWYFLFLFQTLKLMSGPLEIVGTIILPTLAILMLFAIPFIDRGPMRRLRHRTLAIGVVALAAIGWTALTATAIATTPKSEEIDVTAEGGQAAPAWQQLSPEELTGLGYFRKENCKACHPGGGKKGIGPALAAMPAVHRTPEWMVPHFKNPSGVVPGSTMPPVQLNDAQLHALTAFVVKLTPQNEQTLLNVPDFAVQGAMIYEANHCNACHQINGAGTKLGPPLNGVSKRRDRAWLERHFLDPKGVSPGTVMPAYKFSDKEMDDICRYLLSL
jgi:quinol-cytochrome oxidoreductase complex cytochrome b subunit/cbb3-type cytochrome oxidase cytochrome c subunit